MDEPVEYGVGVSRLGDHLMPLRHRELAGDDGGAAAVALFQDFEEIVTGLIVERLEPPIIEDQELGAAERSGRGA